jgi:hypothetical protein
MSLTNIAELKSRAPIVEVWFALGGGKLHRGRGKAWWRGGAGDNVAIYPKTGTWHDFATAAGGDVVTLVRTVRGCSFVEAVKWLSEFAGIPAPGQSPRQNRAPDAGWAADLEMATYWRVAAEAFAEQALEDLSPFDAERSVPTRLLRVIRLGDLSLVEEFREWRHRYPAMTEAMVQAGKYSNARVQRQLMAWLLGRGPCLTDE